MILLRSKFRSLRSKNFITAPLIYLGRHARREMAWLPWLGVALLVAAMLSPGTVVASRLVFQSPPTATPIPPPPTDTPVPPTMTPAPPTVPPVEPAEDTPTAAPAAPTSDTAAPTGVPIEASPSGEPVPVEPAPPVEETAPAITVPQATPLFQPTMPPASATEPEAGLPSDSESDRLVINKVKLWDTLAVALAYPWFCCGIGLVLLVPVGLLYLEIKGRRRPPVPPEPFSEQEQID